MKTQRLLAAALALAAVVLPSATFAQNADDPGINPFNAVVKLECFTTEPDVVFPWQTSRKAGSGSGFVFEPGRILTCAHCVANATHIRIRKDNEDTLYQGHTEFIDHDCDLAIVRVDAPAFMSEIVTLGIGETPSLQDTVVAVGYPMGGHSISFTRGIVSRIEDRTYAHSLLPLLAIQVDAAINPGNSGGPVIDPETFDVVGIAFQGQEKGESLNYIIPPEIIRHFLKDTEDGTVNGCPDFPFSTSDLENEGARRCLGMANGQTGQLLNQVPNSLSNAFHVGDVLLEIDGYTIANNGNIRIAGNERRSTSYPVYLRQIGESVSVKLLRDGQIVEAAFPAARRNLRTRGFLHDRKPDYFVFGGYVFSTVTFDYLLQEKPDLHDNLLVNAGSPEDEAVVITAVLADASTEGYLGIGGSLVRSANGVKIRNIKHLVEIFDSCQDEFIRLALDRGAEYDEPAYLDVPLLREATPRLLTAYEIPADRSPDLR